MQQDSRKPQVRGPPKREPTNTEYEMMQLRQFDIPHILSHHPYREARYAEKPGRLGQLVPKLTPKEKAQMETQLALISKFCAVEGTFCEKIVPYRGTNTYFFAYPSGAHWEDFTRLLATELEFQEVYGTRWQDVISNNVLFLKVCDLIHGHDYVFAEVTEPNANVLLEIGYALAVGRPTILLKDKRRPEWNRTLLTAFENCFYETRESIVPHIVQAQTNRGDLSESSDRRLPSLEKMGIFETVDDRATIHHLKPKIARDWISSVDKVLKDSYFQVSGTDPNDSPYDEFYPQARLIQGASKVVASLLGTDIQHYEEHNANVAMLIGFALGLVDDHH